MKVKVQRSIPSTLPGLGADTKLPITLLIYLFLFESFKVFPVPVEHLPMKASPQEPPPPLSIIYDAAPTYFLPLAAALTHFDENIFFYMTKKMYDEQELKVISSWLAPAVVPLFIDEDLTDLTGSFTELFIGQHPLVQLPSFGTPKPSSSSSHRTSGSHPLSLGHI